jgi:hypothetical protein
MLRFIGALVVGIAVVALITRAKPVLRLLYVILGLMALNAVLKLTGVIEALAPDRTGVL